ncbi:MAG: hypothetical protein M4579_005085 [Chaenotheca gracillima]|nr:MAG: hypothetical protein M4579_005085 [Chaenotheca gracillima]
MTTNQPLPNRHIDDLWLKALEQLDDEDRKRISSYETDQRRVVEQVLAAAQSKRDTARAKRWSFKKDDGSVVIVRDVFEKVVMSAKTYISAMSVVVQADSIHAGIPWAGVLFLLQVKSYWSDNTAKRIAKSFFKDVESSSRSMQTAVSNADDEMSRIASLVQFQALTDEAAKTRTHMNTLLNDLQTPMLRMARDVSEIQDGLQRKTRRFILHWLSTVPCEEHHKEASAGILKGTGQWFLASTELSRWRTSSSSALFWLHGKIGAGKSKLTSLIIRKFIEEQTTMCRHKTDGSERNLAGYSAAIDMSKLSPSLRGSVAAMYRVKAEDVDEKGTQIPKLEADETVEQILKIAEDDPVTIVIDALDEAHSETRRTILDALEKIMRDSPNVVKVFVSSRRDSDLVDSLEKYINVGITSTSNQADIAQFVRTELENAIKSKRLLRGRVSAVLRNEIIDKLINKAQGMFRWVELSLETLCDSRRILLEKDVRNELHQLPRGLKKQYQVIYDDILASAPSTGSVATRLFSWMLAAERVMSTEELVAAVALDDDGSYHEDLNVLVLLDICRNLIIETTIDDDSKEKTLGVAHLSFREFLEELPEFSTKRTQRVVFSRCLNELLPYNSVSNEEAAEALRARHFRNYSIYVFEHAQNAETTERSESIPKITELLFGQDYGSTAALEEWYLLVAELRRDHKRVSTGRYRSLYRDLFQRYDFTFPPINLICIYGLLSVVEWALLVKRFPWKALSSSRQYTPLADAARKGHVGVARLLLELKIFDVNEIKGVGPALNLAVARGHLEVVDLFLKHGASPIVRFEMDGSRTPIITAIKLRHFSILRKLVDAITTTERNASINLSGGIDWKAESLFEAIKADSLDAVRILLDCGVGVHFWSETNEDGRPPILEVQDIQNPITEKVYKKLSLTPLQFSSAYASFSVVEAVLGKHIDMMREPRSSNEVQLGHYHVAPQDYINLPDVVGRTALIHVLERPSRYLDDGEDVMKLLISHGADLSVVSDEGVTALHVAASIGSVEMLDFLLSKGSDVFTTTNTGMTALHYAATAPKCSKSMIRKLTLKGLQPLQKDDRDLTALHYAASACRIDTLKNLLKILLPFDHLKQYLRDGDASGFSESKYEIEQLKGIINTGNKRKESLLHTILSVLYYVLD